MTAGLVFLFIVAWGASIAIGSYLGMNRHNLAAGILMPVALGWIGTAVVACLPDRNQVWEHEFGLEDGTLEAIGAWLDERSNHGS